MNNKWIVAVLSVAFLAQGALAAGIPSDPQAPTGFNQDQVNAEQNPSATVQVRIEGQSSIINSLLDLESLLLNQTVNGAHTKAPRARALSILRTAAAGYPKTAEIFNRVNQYLQIDEIVTPDAGYNFKHCIDGPNVIAFVMFVGGVPQKRIQLCARALKESEKYLAQVLIHEGSHTAGYQNECDATIIEVGAMKLSGEGLAFQNGYMSSCGL